MYIYMYVYIYIYTYMCIYSLIVISESTLKKILSMSTLAISVESQKRRLFVCETEKHTRHRYDMSSLAYVMWPCLLPFPV